ncbi:MAG: phenylalanine--tRNA ligase subunit beta [Gammaproteobacteria bacterium]|nr:phenylalanine--tRNA ligase subunit beta [Gammaproteobacteria bacterium]MBP9728806.1 phenylalanine--tRNA ligase subunit beta [Gammaproteobacteria bacterium]
MKVNEHWLKSFVNYPLALAELADALSYAGIEVEQLESVESTTGAVLTLKIPPNRGDCLSVEGLAREVSAITHTPLSAVPSQTYATLLPETDQYAVQVQASECLNYYSCVIRDLDNTLATPPEIVEKLSIAGITPLSIVMDILAYVMLELGQPLQAFDLQALEGPLVIRKAKALESMKLGDDRSIKLDTEALVIADQKNVQALAGIVGAARSVASQTTTDLLLTSASFDPIAIRQAVQRYGVHSEASYRFERGIDPTLALRALKRALLLITQNTAAKVGPIHTVQPHDFSAHPSTPIFLARKQIQQLLGVMLDDKQVIAFLERLNMQVVPQAEGFHVQPPAYRLDLKRSVDLIEELGRLYGFDRIPAVDFCGTVKAPVLSDQNILDRSLKEVLINRGYSEIISYSFIDPLWTDHLSMTEKPLLLKNPISSEMAMMRSSLWPGLLTALKHNQNRQVKRARLFEMGTCFIHQQDSLCESPLLAGLCVGSVAPEQWDLKGRAHDFYDIKGDVEALVSLLGTDRNRKPLNFEPLHFEALEHPALQAGQSAAIYRRHQKIGTVGALHPRIVKNLDLQGPIWLFEVDQSAFVATIPSFVPLSKFPSVRRDIALLVSKTVLAADLKQSVVASAGEWLQNVIIFDVYEGKALDVAQKSVALGLIFQHPTRTLEETEIKKLVDTIVQNLKQHFQASLRE